MRLTERFVSFARAVAVALKNSVTQTPQPQKTPPEKEDDGLRVVGLFTLPEFKSISSRFDAHGIRSIPVFDTSGPAEASYEGFYERRVVTLFVEESDVPAAAKVFEEWQIQVGRVESEDADPTARANAAQRPS
jgi:hypothetical protein